MNERQWVHQELPEGQPSRAGYQLSCRCLGCCDANREYMKAYRARIQHELTLPDETGQYHSHKGRPSKGSARKWGCTHSRCLALAGATLSADGIGVAA